MKISVFHFLFSLSSRSSSTLESSFFSFYSRQRFPFHYSVPTNYANYRSALGETGKRDAKDDKAAAA